MTVCPHKMVANKTISALIRFFLALPLCLFFASKALASTSLDLTDDEKAFLEAYDPVRVHVETNWPPFNYLEYGEIKGFVNDYMRLLAKRTGMQIEFIVGYSWNEYLQMLQDKRIDAISNMKITPDRESYTAFSNRAVVNTVQGILSLKGTKQFRTLAEIEQAGLSMAVVKGFFHEELLKRHYPKINLLLTDDAIDSIRQVINGNADTAIATHSVFDYYINKHFYTGLNNTPLVDDPKFAKTPQFIGIRKDLPLLKSIIDKGMATITDQEVLTLRKKWSGSVQNDQQTTLSTAKLSLSEKRFLQQKQQVTMCVDPDWMPLEAIENGQHIGMAAEFMDFFQKQLGIPITLVTTTDWAESIQFAKARRCDIYSMAMETPQRLEYMNFTTPYLHIPLIMATRIEELFVPDVSAVRNRKIGIVRGYASAELLRSKYPDLQIVDVDSVKDGLAQVEQGELFGFIGTLTTVGYAIQNDHPQLKIAGKFEDLLEFRVGVRNDEPLLLGIFNKAISVLPNSRQQQIVSNWISVRYEQSFDYSLLWKTLPFVLLLIAALYYRHYKLHQHNAQLRQLSTTDPLTHSANRLYLDEFLEYHINHYRRHHQEFSVLLCDLDYFKEINDKYGHLSGDQVLIEFVALLKSNVRSSDLVGRWGGEEFLVVCPNTNAAEALKLAEKLRQQIEEHTFSEIEHLTTSIGVANYHDTDENITDFMRRVDQALYQSKKQGRNKSTLVTNEQKT